MLYILTFWAQAAENDYQWKDCLCNDIQDKVCTFKDSPASGGGDEERDSRVDGLPDFTEESWSTGHPPARPLSQDESNQANQPEMVESDPKGK